MEDLAVNIIQKDIIINFLNGTLNLLKNSYAFSSYDKRYNEYDLFKIIFF